MKRLLDILISLILFIIFLPIFLIIAICIKADSEGPVFFKQMRIGKNNNLFKLYKFRTMNVGTPNVATDKLQNAKSYVTVVGKVLRKTSLDELPQLINILKGDMTFIGPRPALYNQYNLKELRTMVGVHILLPGITGWAQINGRDHNDDVKKTDLDKYYLENQSFMLDIRILIMTLFKVLRAEAVVEGANKYNENIENRDGNLRHLK